jgi:hypothetical protein
VPGTDAIDHIALYLPLDNGRTFGSLVGESDGGTSGTWTPPATESDSAYLKVIVSDTNGLTGSDVSDARFQLRNLPRVTSVTPMVVSNVASATVRLNGGNLSDIAHATLTASGETDIDATSLTNASSAHIDAVFPVTNAAPGWRALRVESARGYRDTLDQAIRLVAPPAVALTAPNGGEVVVHGATESVTWTATQGTDALDHFTAWLSISNGRTFPTQFFPANASDRAARWSMPEVATDSARIQIVAADVNGITSTDASDDPFAILGAAVNVQSVSPGILGAGSGQTLAVHGAGFLTGASVWFTGASVETTTALSVVVQSATDLVANFDLTGAALGPRTVTVRNPGGATNSLENAVQVVSAPLIHVSAPNGGERLLSNMPTQIHWTIAQGANPVAQVSVFLSADGGISYPRLIGTVGPNDTALVWTPPDTAQLLARVRLVAVDTSGVSSGDESDGDFAVISSAGPWLLASYPNTASLVDSLGVGLVGGNVYEATAVYSGSRGDAQVRRLGTDCARRLGPLRSLVRGALAGRL